MRTTTVVRAVAVGAALAVLTACGTGSESSSDDTSASNGSSGPVTISWWHNSNTDPGKGVLRRGRQGLRGLPPRRDDPGQRDAARGHAHQARRGLPERRRPRHLHGARWRRARRPRRGGPHPGHLRVGQGRHRDRRRLGGRAGRSTARRTPCRSRSEWWASGTTSPSSRRPASPSPPDHDGRAVRRGRQAQGRRHRPGLGRRRRQVAGRALLVLPRAARVPEAGAARTP